MGDDMSGFRLPTYLDSLPQVGVGNPLGTGMSVLPSNASFASAMPTGGSSFLDSFFRSKDPTSGLTTGGWGEAGLGIASGLASAWMGMQQYGLAKDTLQANKDQFNKNYAAQKQTTNASLEDRQRARVASNPGAYQSVGTYMQQNGIA